MSEQSSVERTQPFIVGIRFSKIGKVYHFDATEIPDLRNGEPVIVETSRGWQMGSVAEIVENPTTPPEGAWKPVERRATPRDLLMRQSWQNHEGEVIAAARKRAGELNLSGMKVVAAEYSFDGLRLAILFNTESEEKVDLKSLRSDMQRQFAPAQVELRQIGPRDVAKLLGGMGACGMESRCCSKFLTEFSSISIRMAKEQGISLTPTEITGMCGRLRCCLIYEYEQYVAARAQLPKRNKRVITPLGEGKVVDVSPLREMVLVEIPEQGVREYHKDELKPADEYDAFVQKAQGGCDKSESGGCDCGHGNNANPAGG
jgi:cell fate regulator YaaT (PSP1 superfamily)